MDTLDLRHGDGYGLYMQALETTRQRIANALCVTPERVIPTCGGTAAIDLVLGSFGQTSRIAVMANEYYDIHALATQHGHTVLQAIDPDNGMDTFHHHITNIPDLRAVYLSLPNNPLGISYPVADLITLIGNANHNGRTIIMDQSLVDERPLPMSWFKERAPQAKIAIIRSFSKTHGAVADRAGYVVMPCKPLLLHPFTHTPSFATLQKMWQWAEDAAKPTKVLQRIRSNNRRMRAWANRKDTVRWQPSETNFGVLHLEELTQTEVVERLRAQMILLKHAADLSCSGRFLRIPLDASPRQIGLLLEALDRFIT